MEMSQNIDRHIYITRKINKTRKVQEKHSSGEINSVPVIHWQTGNGNICTTLPVIL